MTDSPTENMWEPASLHAGMNHSRDPAKPAERCPKSRPRVEVRNVDGVTVVELLNADVLFDGEAIREVSAQLQRLVADHHRRLLLNLQSVRYASSSVIALMASLSQRVHAAGGWLKICGLDPLLVDAIRICRLDQTLDVYRDEAEALATKPFASDSACDR
jgi:anti-sigma B factor antagonist